MSKYIAFYIIYVICYTQLMPITWRIVVKICLNPCPWYCGCSSVSGSRYGRCCHQTNNNKTWSGTQPPNIHGPSIILTSTAQSGTVLQIYHFAKCGDQFSASSDDNCVHIDLNDEKSARKERFWKYLQATSVQRRPCLGAVMMSLCHTEASCP